MNQNETRTARLSIIVSMLIFGTIGIFRTAIPLPSSVIALARGTLGTLFLLIFSRLRAKPIGWADVRRHWVLLVVSGALIGFNWILLFEAYRYTTVATATLCYYFAPVFVILASPLLVRERLTLWKGLCVLVALVGMVFVSGVTEVGISGAGEMLGILYGVGAAVLYACVVLMNKKLTQVPGFDRTIVQLGAAALALLPYVLVTERDTVMVWQPSVIALLLVVGIVHTAIAYTLYFGAIKDLPAQTSALFSYIDPVSAIILSALLLHERMSALGAVGAVLVLGATLLSELPVGQKSK